MLENRKLMKRVFPELFAAYPCGPVKDYPSCSCETLLPRRARGRARTRSSSC